MSNATTVLGSLSPTILGAHRVADIFAALTPPAPAAGVPSAPAPSNSQIMDKAKQFAPGLAGAGVGAYVGAKHRHPVLGALAGHAVVNSAYEYYKGDKKKAVCNAAVEGAALAGALYYKKGRKPLLGYAIGLVAGAVATYFVDGSPVKNAVAKYRK